jgi:antimicrobial peptide system SdpB family protein
MFFVIGRWVRDRIQDTSPWTNVYGLARTIIAGAQALTFACNHSAVLFPLVGGTIAVPPFCDGSRRFGLFCVLPSAHLEVARWLGVLILAVVASGWRPRITGVLHAWVSMSFMSSAITLEGGDQLSAILAFLLVPITLTDTRRWHWEAAVPATGRTGEDLRRVAALSAYLLIRVQMAFVYFHAAIGKFFVREWQDGTALYYWGRHPVFGAAAGVRAVMEPLLVNAVPVALLTWGVILLEVLLSMALFMGHTGRRILLAFGVALHVGILLVHGLATFGVCMCGCLILYLRPLEQPFASPTLSRLWTLMAHAGLPWIRRFRLPAPISPSPRMQDAEP